tara:strand:+ start:577 stop:786 length:210 start_codon:yes stop_codon:yes gene_type:complete
MFTPEQITKMLEFYYKIDVDNCGMTNKDWLDLVVQALTDKDFMIDFMDDFIEYIEERELTLSQFFNLSE